MWCILCCQNPSTEDVKRSTKESQHQLDTQKRESGEQAALITPRQPFADKACENIDGGNSKQLIEQNQPTSITENTTVDDKPLQARSNRQLEQQKEQVSKPQQNDLSNSNGTAESAANLTQRAARSDGMSVSFNTCVESEPKTRTSNQQSASDRPVWTLKDVLDSPYHCVPNTTTGVSEDLVITLTEAQRDALSNQSQSAISSSQSLTKFGDEGAKQPRESILSRRHTRPGSMYHHTAHATFFLPRISTDPTTGHDTLDRSSSVSDGKSFPIRRGSMIVRSGRTTTASSGNIQSGNTESSLTGSGMGVEGFIVTPFAQVLVSMQRIRSAFIRLTAIQSNNKFGVNSSAVTEPGIADILVPESQEYKTVASETLEELEWCLKQLENIETKRPVSDMAFSKFKRLLNKELNSFGEADKSRHEISAYICGTFLEDEKDAQANQEIEQMLERRRSSGQSHGSGGTAQESSVGVSPSGTKTQTQQSQQRTSLLTPDSGLTKLEEKPEGSHMSDSSSSPLKPARSADDGSASPNANKRSVSASENHDINDQGNSQQVLPMHGIETSNDAELDDRFSQYLDTWGLDIFEIDRLSGGHALTTTTYRIFQNRDLMRTFSIDPATLVRFLLKVEQNYHPDVPYHNALHAADVIQTSHFLLQAEPLEDVFSDLEILAVLFASAVHDVDHPGLTNQFLINTGHDLALQYNDTSVLENHHLYVAFKLLNEPDCDVFAALAAKKRQTLRRMVIELVLATDMSKHMSLLADLRTMVETKKVSGSGLLNLDNYSDRIQILQNMIHCADLSNPAKPLRLNRKWTGRLMEEFFRQGDKERMLKIEISPMCDRESVAIEKSQVTFIDFVAHPLLESWCDLVHPSAQLILDTLADNRDWYECQAEGPRPSGANKGRPRLATAEEDEEEEQVASSS